MAMGAAPIRGGEGTHPDSQRIMGRLIEPIGFVMDRRMLLGLNERAAGTAAPEA